MGRQELGEELKAISPVDMVEAVKATSWKLGSGEALHADEVTAMKEEYPAFGAAIELMIAADMGHGRSIGEAYENVASAAWVLLSLKQLIDQDQIERIVGE